jgi:hypothetical protein
MWKSIRFETSYKRVFVTVLQISLVVAGFYSFLLLTIFDNSMPRPNRLDQSIDWKAIRQMEIDYWNNIRVDTMTPQQILDYFRWSNHTSCDVYNYFGGKIYFMNPTAVDGQYPVCLDPQVKPTTNTKCLVYSFGINDNWSFDEFMEWYGCQVFSFDPSINKLDHEHSEDIHFYNLGLGHESKAVDSNGWAIKTLDSIYKMLLPRHGANIIDYLKMDIEWSEWKALQQIIDSGMLSKVRQLSVEFHLPHQDEDSLGSNMNMTIEDYRSLVNLVKSIEKQMTRFASRGTLWCNKRIKVLDNYFGNVCIEITFYQILPYA